MRPLEPLAPDQRAVVALVLQHGRSYDEIAALLGIPVDAVRARAQAGLVGLAPANGLPREITGPLADYLLGQQPDRDAASTRGLLAESAPARAWARGVAERLASVAKDPLPAIPAPAQPPAAAAPTANETAAAPAGAAPAGAAPAGAAPAAGDPAAPAASSRIGGAILIAAVLAVVGVVVFLVLRSGEDGGDEQVAASAPAQTATPTASAAPAQVADEIVLRAAGGGEAKGTMTVYLQGDRLGFTVEATGVPPSGNRAAYAIWLTGPGDRARRLGFASVGADGKLGIQGPSARDASAFPRLYATFATVAVSRETSEDAKRPSRVLLRGTLPSGR